MPDGRRNPQAAQLRRYAHPSDRLPAFHPTHPHTQCHTRHMQHTLARKRTDRACSYLHWCRAVAALYSDLDGGFTPLNFLLPSVPFPANARRDAAQLKLSNLFIGIIQERRAHPEQVHTCTRARTNMDVWVCVMSPDSRGRPLGAGARGHVGHADARELQERRAATGPPGG
jgi:hypothetical protein